MTWQRFALTRSECLPFLADNADLPDRLEQGAMPPPWRRFMPAETFIKDHADDARTRWQHLREIRRDRARQKAASFVLPNNDPCKDLVLAVNASLALRRPLLVTGLPGSGKTTLAYVLAEWLGLGPVLEWPVSPGALLADALATYNPLARLQDLELAKQSQRPQENGGEGSTARPDLPPVERYIRLGPVGTAFLPAPIPRVLLIDEIDKGDLNLANELLHLFEEGKFSIPELQRAERDKDPAVNEGMSTEGVSKEDTVRMVDTWDKPEKRPPLQARIFGGEVQCHAFPLVVMSSNGERDFPPAFNRRCLRVAMPNFSSDPSALKSIVASHLEGGDSPLARDVDDALEIFLEAVKREQSQADVLATDQLLNLAFLMDGSVPKESRASLKRVLLQGLNSDMTMAEGTDGGD